MSNLIKAIRITAKTIKASTGSDGEWLLDVLAVPFGGPNNGRDDQGEYFDERTDLMLDVFKHRPVFYYHGLDEPGTKERIGDDLGYQIKSDGVWLKVALNKTSALAKKVWASAKKGLASASSGSMDHIVPPVGKDGWIPQWPFAEISLMDETKKPINSFAIARPALRAAYKAAGIPIPDPLKKEKHTTHEPRGLATRGAKGKGVKAGLLNKDNIMDLEQLRQALIDGGFAVELVEEIIERLMSAAGNEAPQTDAKAEEEKEEMVKAVIEKIMDAAKTDTGMQGVTEENVNAKIKALFDANRQGAIDAAVAKHAALKARNQKQIDDAIKAASLKAQMDAPPLSKIKGGGGVTPPAPATDVTDRRYDHMTASEMQVGYLVMKAKRMQNELSPEYMRAMAMKSVAHADSDPYKDPKDNSAIKASVRRLKADEIMATNIAGQGTEWVGIQYATEKWDKARFSRIMSRLQAKGMLQREIPQGFSGVYVPLVGDDPIVYASPQANDLDGGNRIESTVSPGFVGTARQLFSPGELKAAVGITDIEMEDSVINAVAQINEQMQDALNDHVDKLFLNGDTETAANTNVNLIDDTPGTGVTTPYYIASDGALKYALVTGSSTSSDLNLGGLEITDYLTLEGLLPDVVSEEEDDLLFIQDPATFRATKALPELATTDVAGQYATIQGGKLLQIYGIDNVRSGFMALANTAGKIPAAGGSLGRILLVYPKYWGVAWKRHIKVEVVREGYAGADVFIGSMRVGFKARGAGASVVGYNIPV